MPLCILPVLRNFYRQNKQSDIYILPGDIRVRIPQKLDVLAFRSWNLDVVAFWSWNPDVVVYMSPRPRFRFHSENRKTAQNILNYVKEYSNYPNLCNSYPCKGCISELE